MTKNKPALIEETITLFAKDRRIFLREGSHADREVFSQIFVQQQYDTAIFPQDAFLWIAYHDIIEKKRSPIIIDCGAYIGLSALYYSTKYPEAIIVAIEPDEENHNMLKRNTETIANVITVNSAVDCRNNAYKLVDLGFGEWGYRIEGCTTEIEGNNRTKTINDLVNLCGGKLEDLFIIKIDIEGSEYSLFQDNLDWIASADLIVAELHDRLFPGQGRSAPFLKAVAEQNRDFLYSGENVFSFKCYSTYN